MILSPVSTAKILPCREPSLPLQDGRLTCNTWHYHRRPAGKGYKLVRLVTFTASGVEWTILCQDCHRDE